jgi:hypothetical protein
MKTGEPIMSPNRRASRANDLILIAPVESFHDSREPPLNLGNKVRLNSGGPEMLVVEIDEDNVTVQQARASLRIHDSRRVCSPHQGVMRGLLPPTLGGRSSSNGAARGLWSADVFSAK